MLIKASAFKSCHPDKNQRPMKVGLFVFIVKMIKVYILYSFSLDQFYKGQTSELKNRLERHNSGYEEFTRKGLPWKLIWSTEKENRSQAIKLEKKLKNLGRKQTIQFILKYRQGVAGPDELLFIKQLSGC